MDGEPRGLVDGDQRGTSVEDGERFDGA